VGERAVRRRKDSRRGRGGSSLPTWRDGVRRAHGTRASEWRPCATIFSHTQTKTEPTENEQTEQTRRRESGRARACPMQINGWRILFGRWSRSCATQNEAVSAEQRRRRSACLKRGLDVC